MSYPVQSEPTDRAQAQKAREAGWKTPFVPSYIIPSEISPTDFTLWRRRMALSKTAAAEALGISRNMPAKYEDGSAEIPRTVALACAALIRGIQPWPN